MSFSNETISINEMKLRIESEASTLLMFAFENLVDGLPKKLDLKFFEKPTKNTKECENTAHESIARGFKLDHISKEFPEEITNVYKEFVISIPDITSPDARELVKRMAKENAQKLLNVLLNMNNIVIFIRIWGRPDGVIIGELPPNPLWRHSILVKENKPTAGDLGLQHRFVLRVGLGLPQMPNMNAETTLAFNAGYLTASMNMQMSYEQTLTGDFGTRVFYARTVYRGLDRITTDKSRLSYGNGVIELQGIDEEDKRRLFVGSDIHPFFVLNDNTWLQSCGII
jgi:hypothetical protein